MPRRGLWLIALLVWGAPALGEEPMSAAEIADALVASADDPERFAAIAAGNAPDPWMVCETLVRKGHADLAARAAKVEPRPATLGLDAYLASRTEDESVTAIADASAQGGSLLAERRFDEALPALDDAAARALAIGWIRRAGSILHHAGLAAYRLGDARGAAARWTKRIEAEAKSGRYANAWVSAKNVAVCARDLRDAELAASAHEAVMAVVPESGDDAYRFQLHQLVGNILARHNRYQDALLVHEQGLAVARRLRTPGSLVDQLVAVGTAYQELNRYTKAEAHFEEARTVAAGLDDPTRQAQVEQKLGYVHLGVKDNLQALAHLERALALYRKAGNELEVARGHMNVGAVQGELGKLSEAKASLLAANEGLETLGDQINLARSLTMTASLHQALDQPEKATPLLERVLAIYETVDDLEGRIGVRITLAGHRSRLGDHERARSELELATIDANRHGGWAMRTWVLEARAWAEHRARAFEAVETVADKAVELLPNAGTGAADRDAATVRTRFSEILGLAALASHHTSEPAKALRYLERIRAADVRAAFQTGSSKRPAIPEDLLAAEASARMKEAEARQTLDAARKSGRRKAIRRTRAAHDRASRALDDVIEQIRAIERAATALTAPVTLDAVQRALPSGAVLVVYGRAASDEPGLAIVIRAANVRTVELAAAKTIRAACLAVGVGREAGSPAAVERLRSLVLEPLGLTPEDRLVLVSPTGALGLVPLALLLPDREVAFVPSASAYVGSRAVDVRVDQVLALGDPDYSAHARSEAQSDFRERGGLLSPLPGTREEVEAIADVSLVGKGASEEVLRTLVEQSPWAAIHLACHGLIDDEDPMRSSLAVSASGRNDGFITVQDVLRLPIRARLVTLSACDSGRGEVVQGVGMLGLSQAFMTAGAKSVLCSLWKVDDDATRTLMIRFYELWRGGDVAATEALRQAMAHVRSHEEWRDPYFWAAWVLWNTPE